MNTDRTLGILLKMTEDADGDELEALHYCGRKFVVKKEEERRVYDKHRS